MANRIQQLEALGQSVWLDYIRRDDLVSGAFDAHVRDGVLGVTSNPTIFHQAITQGAGYDAALEKGVAEGATPPRCSTRSRSRTSRPPATICSRCSNGPTGATGA